MRYSLSLSELTKLLAVAKSHDANHHLLLLLAFRHGLRVSEVCHLTPKNVVYGNQLKVQRLKNSLLTVQPLARREDDLWDELTPLLARILVLRGELEGPLFPGPRGGFISRFQVRRLIKRYGVEAGIEPVKLHPHILKHSCGMFTIKSGIEMTRDWLGHKSIASTGYYLKPGADEVNAAVEKAMGI